MPGVSRELCWHRLDRVARRLLVGSWANVFVGCSRRLVGRVVLVEHVLPDAEQRDNDQRASSA
jgi:hypothetical protein